MTLYKIAGVTFDNEDGTKRQDLLKNLYDHFLDQPFVVQANHTTYENEPAIQLISNGHIIGWIPKTDVDKIPANSINMVCYLNKSDIDGKTIYFGSVRPAEAPSAKQYAIVMRKYRSHKITKLPIYDKYIYSQAIGK